MRAIITVFVQLTTVEVRNEDEVWHAIIKILICFKIIDKSLNLMKSTLNLLHLIFGWISLSLKTHLILNQNRTNTWVTLSSTLFIDFHFTNHEQPLT